MGKNYYQILGISRTADDKEIKSAYKRLALKYHPDKNDHPQAVDHFREVVAAFEILSDKEKRKIYDNEGEEALKFESTEPNTAQASDDMLPFMIIIGGSLLFAFVAYEIFHKEKSSSSRR